MNSLRLVLASASFVILILQEPAFGQSVRDTTVFVGLERTWNDAHLHGDRTALDQLWSADLAVTVPGMEPMGKEVVLGMVGIGGMLFTRYETSDLKIRVLGDLAVVTGRLLRTRLRNDLEVVDDWRFSKIYRREAGTWRVILFHASASPR